MLRHFKHLKGLSLVSAEIANVYVSVDVLGERKKTCVKRERSKESCGSKGGVLTGSLMSAAVFASAESAITELALVFLLRGGGSLLGRRIAGRGGNGGSHVNRRCRTAGRRFFSEVSRREMKRLDQEPFGTLTPDLEADE